MPLLRVLYAASLAMANEANGPQLATLVCTGSSIQALAALRLCSLPGAPAAGRPACAAQRRRGGRGSHPIRLAAAPCQSSAAQDIDNIEIVGEEQVGAPTGTSAASGDTLAALPDAVTEDDAAAAERRASGRLASTSEAGGGLEPVAVARCHTLAAEVWSHRVPCCS